MNPYRLAVWGLLLFFCGCSVEPRYRKISDYLSRDQCSQAVAYMEENEDDYGNNERLLFLLDSAMVNLQCKNLQAAQKNFHAAEDLAQKLWTESISRNVASIVTNDYILPYPGEDFERVLIHLFSAIGYLEENNLDGALVECRKLDSLLTSYNASYEEKNVYKEDALARYLSGMLHEADREMDDAFIDYYKARMVYEDYHSHYGTPVPDILEEDLLRLAEVVDRVDDAERLLGGKKRSLPFRDGETAELGRIVLVYCNGNAPRKKEDAIHIPTKYGPITLAFPRFELDPPACRPDRLVLEANGKRIETGLYLAEDINRIAEKNLDDRKARVIAKAIARAVAKQALVNELTSETKGTAKDLIRLAFNLANTLLLERADTRCWRTLPGEIHLARVFVKEGTYTLHLPRCSRSAESLPPVSVKAGETRFIFHDARYP